ncbi:hypothetical protein C8R44DRAFT_887988 [Mycena epipterygia]|nr:hypothetical protein C8R44DRAFT_887988 [Mycena epipterygia]
MHPLRFPQCSVLLFLLGLQANGQGSNLLSNPTLQTSGSSTVPDDWSLRGSGFASGLGGTTSQAMALSSTDPQNPSVFSQSIPTLSSLDYQFTFDAFATQAGKGEQNLTISFGVGTWWVQPPGQWASYSFTARGRGSDDVVQFSAADPSGGNLYVYDLALVSVGVDTSSSVTHSATLSAQSSMAVLPSAAQSSAVGGPSVLPPAGDSDSSLSRGALIATIAGPVVTLIGAILTWWKWADVKSCCCGRRRAVATPQATTFSNGDSAKVRDHEELPLVSYTSSYS